jgi:DNA-binding LacI/PurR family transcriptional regulator
LLQRIELPDKPAEQVRLKTELLIRGSTAKWNGTPEADA